MSKISEIIENHIIALIKESQGTIDIQRNELAIKFDCAPSQINYVLTTRFTSNRGYIIESRRGGGGYIRIMRIDVDENDYLRHLLSEEIGNSISKEAAQQLVEVLCKRGFMDKRIKNIINTVVDDTTLSLAEKPLRDKLRAEILKSVIVAALI